MSTFFSETWPDTSFSQWDDEGSLNPPTLTASGGVLTATLPASTHSYIFYSPTASPLPSLADGASFAWKADIDNEGNTYSVIDLDFNGIARQGVFSVARDWDVSFYSDGSVYVVTGGGGSNTFSVDPASTFYRLRRGGDTVYFESSPDGASGWTTVYSEADYVDAACDLTLTLSISATASGTGVDARLGRFLYGLPAVPPPPSVPALAPSRSNGRTYTYLFADLRTNALLAELPLRNVSFDLALNGAGAFAAEVPLRDPRLRKLDVISSTQPARTAIYVDKDGVLVWGGILWTRAYAADTDTLAIGGNEFWSYFRRRLITVDTDYFETDQLTIAQNLVNTAQASSGGNIGVIVGGGTSGVVRDFEAISYDLKNVAEEIEALAQLDHGFDFAIDVAWENGIPVKRLNWGYPRRGRTVESNHLIFDFPGNLRNYNWSEDGTGLATTVYVQGDGDGAEMIQSSVSTPALITAGFPALDGVYSPRDVDDQTQADDLAQAGADAAKTAVTIPELHVAAGRDPRLGAYVVGDDAMLVFSPSPRFPNGMTTTQRITGIAVTPSDSGTAEDVVITVGDPVA